MKYSAIFFFFITLLFSCTTQLKIIPEVSPPIEQEDLYSSQFEKITEELFAVSPHLIYFTRQGQVIQFDPRTRAKKEVFSLGNAISSIIFSQPPYILLQAKKDNSFIVFNLKTMGIIHRFHNPRIRRIIGMDDQFIYHYRNKKLSVFNYHSGTTIKERSVRQKILHCEIRQNSAYILSIRRLYIYDKSAGIFKDFPLKINASSPFLLVKDSIYFGSTNRQLVRFSLKTKTIQWKFKLTQLVTEKPLLMDRYIVVTPEDHTICYFTPRGTLAWWTHLRERRIGSPIIMKENIAVFQSPRSKPRLTYVNIKKKSQTTATCNTSILGNPAVLGEFIYFFSPPPEKTGTSVKPESLHLNRIGNSYRTEIISKPEKLKSIGKTIRFELKPVNLIRPEHHIKIFNSEKQTILEKKIKWGEAPRFVWIPAEQGTYSIWIKSDAQNISDIQLEEGIKITDAQKTFNDHYYRIQNMCQTPPD